MKLAKKYFKLFFIVILTSISLMSCKNEKKTIEPQANIDGIMFALLRNVNEGVSSTDKAHGYAIMDFNPYSDKFGDTIQTISGPLGHHGYISPVNGGLYVTQADDLAARVNVTIESNGFPKIQSIRPSVDDNDMRVG